MAQNMANIIIKAQTAGARSELGKLNRAFGDTATRSSKMKAALESAFLPAAAITAAGALIIARQTKMASDYNEALSYTGVLYGKNAEKMRKWADAAAASKGLNATEALNAANSFKGFFQGLKVAEHRSTLFSKQLTQLAADMTSAFNLQDGEAIDKLMSTLAGETEPLRKFGVVLNDQVIKQRAVRLGYIKTTKEALTPQAKAMTIYRLVMEKTTKQQGDYKRTADGAANSTRTLRKRFDNLNRKMGQIFLKYLGALLPPLEALSRWVEKNPRTFAILVGGITALAATVAGAAGIIKIAGAITGIVAAIGGLGALATVGAIIGVVVAAVIGLAGAFLYLYENSESFKWIADKVWEILKEIGGFIKNVAIAGWEKLSRAVKDSGGWFEFAKEAVKVFGIAVSLGVVAIFKLIDACIDLWRGLDPIGKLKVAWAGVELAVLDAKKKLDEWKTAIAALVTTVIDKVEAAWDKVKKAVGTAAGNVGDWGLAIGKLGTSIITKLAEAWERVASAVGSAWGYIKQIADKLSGSLGNIINKIPGMRIAPQATRVAVAYQTAPQLRAAGPSGFSMKQTSGVSTLNITVNAVDGEGAARAVRKILKDHDRRQGRVGRYA